MDNLKSLLAEKADRIGPKTYIYFRERTLTHSEVNLLSNRFAHIFHSLGVRKGDHVAVMLHNCPEWIAGWFGLAKLGAVLVAFNTQWKADGLEYALKQADVKCCLVAAEFQTEFKKLGEHPELIKILFDLEGGALEIGEAHALSSILPKASTDEPKWDAPEGPDPLIITYTSGTTGWPKAVVNPHRAYIAAAEDLRDYVDLKADDIIYTCL
ncbi:MAG: AMP-binding protein, partial [Deltaproteobacteria bacterium]|nr:AMP-binding protein [Deltaproteobacteria bacterium]